MVWFNTWTGLSASDKAFFTLASERPIRVYAYSIFMAVMSVYLTFIGILNEAKQEK